MARPEGLIIDGESQRPEGLVIDGEEPESSLPEQVVSAAKAAGRLIGEQMRAVRDAAAAPAQRAEAKVGEDMAAAGERAAHSSTPAPIQAVGAEANDAIKVITSQVAESAKIRKAHETLNQQIDEGLPQFKDMMKWAERSKLGSLASKITDVSVSGTAQAAANAARLPALGVDVLNMKHNLTSAMLSIAKYGGNPEASARADEALAMSPELSEQRRSPDALINNPVALHFDKKAKEFSARVPEMSEDVIALWRKGEYKKFVQVAALQSVQSAPEMAVMLGTAMLGYPNVALAGMGLSSASGANAAARATGADPLMGTANALVNGSMEIVGEHVGSLAFVENMGARIAKAVGKRNVVAVMHAIGETLIGGPIIEGVEEAVTSLGQDASSVMTGVDPSAATGYGDRAIGAAIGGFALGHMSSGAAILNGGLKARINEARGRGDDDAASHLASRASIGVLSQEFKDIKKKMGPEATPQALKAAAQDAYEAIKHQFDDPPPPGSAPPPYPPGGMPPMDQAPREGVGVPMPVDPNHIATMVIASSLDGPDVRHLAENFPFVYAASSGRGSVPEPVRIKYKAWEEGLSREMGLPPGTPITAAVVAEAVKTAKTSFIELDALNGALIAAAATAHGAQPEVVGRVIADAKTAAGSPAMVLTAYHAERQAASEFKAARAEADAMVQKEAELWLQLPQTPSGAPVEAAPAAAEAPPPLPGRAEGIQEAVEQGVPLDEAAAMHRAVALEQGDDLDPEIAAGYPGDIDFDPAALEAAQMPFPDTAKDPAEMTYAEFKAEFPEMSEEQHKAMVDEAAYVVETEARKDRGDMLEGAGISAMPAHDVLRAWPIGEDWIEKLGLSGEFKNLKGRGITKKIGGDEGKVDYGVSRLIEAGVLPEGSSINDMLDLLDHESRKGTKASAKASMVREGQEGPGGPQSPSPFDPSAKGAARGLESGTPASVGTQPVSREAHLQSLIGQPYLDSITAAAKEGKYLFGKAADAAPGFASLHPDLQDAFKVAGEEIGEGHVLLSEYWPRLRERVTLRSTDEFDTLNEMMDLGGIEAAIGDTKPTAEMFVWLRDSRIRAAQRYMLAKGEKIPDSVAGQIKILDDAHAALTKEGGDSVVKDEPAKRDRSNPELNKPHYSKFDDGAQGMLFDEKGTVNPDAVAPPATEADAAPAPAGPEVLPLTAATSERKSLIENPTDKPITAGELTDSGEELWYNRRNLVSKGLKWDDIRGMNSTLKALEVQKTKIWPRPDYAELVSGGMNPLTAHLVKQVYDSISTKPSVSGTATDAQMEAYVNEVARVKEAVFSWAKDIGAQKDLLNNLMEAAKARMGGISLISQMGRGASSDALLDALYPKNAEGQRWGRTMQAQNDLISLIGGNKLIDAMRVNTESARTAVKAINQGWPAPQESWEKRFDIREVPAGTKQWSREKGEHTTTVAHFEIKVRASRGMMVRGEFPTREAAVARAKELAAKKPDTRRQAEAALTEFERTGPPQRPGGLDVTPKALQDKFQFRGINYGNYTDQGERQVFTNNAYDSLLDLADLMGLPAQAISLNGTLGLAYGAQGRGGKYAAHFVPGVNEINLTKDAGAGSLAHEWWHALDHYFAVQAGESYAKGAEPYLTHLIERGEWDIKSGSKAGALAGLRPEIRKAFLDIVESMKKVQETPEQVDARIESYRAISAKRLESWLKHFRDRLNPAGTISYDPKTGRNVTKALEGKEAAVRANYIKQFDLLADALRRGDVGEGWEKIGTGAMSAVRTNVGEIRRLYKDVTGHMPSPDDIKALDSSAYSINAAKDAKRVAEEKKAQSTRSQYLKGAMGLDAGKKKGYWMLETELGARAFQSYILDKLGALNRRNDYLTRPQAAPADYKEAGGDPYPRGVEREKINAAFDVLVKSLLTKESPTGGTMVYDAPAEFKKAGEKVDGRLVRKDVPNTASIEASLGRDYEIQPGIYEVPVIPGKPKFYSVSEEARTGKLAEEIKASGEINPLIIVVKADGSDYILEGGHRYDALRMLGAKSFPAVIVKDTGPSVSDEQAKAFGPGVDVDAAMKQIEMDLGPVLGPQFAKEGRLQYQGMKAETKDEVAAIVAAARLEGLEHLHILMRNKKGKVVAHMDITSFRPNATMMTKEQKAQALKMFKDLGGKKAGITVSSVHNHPAGNPTPSEADHNFHAELQAHFEGAYNETLVTDHIEFAAIGADGAMRREQFNEPLPQYYKPKGPVVQSASEIIAAAAKSAMIGKSHVVLFMDARNHVISMEHFEKGTNIPAAVKDGILRHKASSANLVAPIGAGFISDLPNEVSRVMQVDESGKASSLLSPRRGESAYGEVASVMESSMVADEPLPRYMGGEGMDAADFAKAIAESKIVAGSKVTARAIKGVEKGAPGKVLSVSQKTQRLVVQFEGELVPRVVRAENLAETNRKPAARLAVEAAEKAAKTSGQPSQPTKRTITEQQAGLADENLQEQISEQLALREALRAEAKGARGAAREGQRTLRHEIRRAIEQGNWEQATRAKIVQLAKEALDPADRHVALTIVANAKSHGDLLNAFWAIEAKADDVHRKESLADIKIMFDRIMRSPTFPLGMKKIIQERFQGIRFENWTPRTMEKIKADEALVRAMQDDGENIIMPSALLEKINALASKPLGQMPTSVIDEILDFMKMAEAKGIEVRNLIKAMEGAQRLADLAEMVTVKGIKSKISTEGHATGALDPALSWGKENKNKFLRALDEANRAKLVMTPMQMVVEIIDGKEDGPLSRLVMDRIQSRFSDFLTDDHEYLRRRDAMIEKWGNIPKEEAALIGVIIHAAQEGGEEKLIQLGIGKDRIDLILKEFNDPGSKNYARHKEMVAYLREMIQFRTDEMVREEAFVHNKDVQLINDYFPMLTDHDFPGEAHIQLDPGEQFSNYRRQVEAKFLKERVANAKQKIILDPFKALDQHIQKKLWFVHTARVLKQVNGAVKDPAFQAAAGDVGATLMNQYLDALARMGGVEGSRKMRWLANLRRGMGAASICFNPGSALIQPSSLADGAAKIGGKWIGRGMTMAADSEWQDVFNGLAPKLKYRGEGRNIYTDVMPGSPIGKMEKLGSAPIRFGDEMSSRVVFGGAYALYHDMKGLTLDKAKPNREAAKFAQKIMDQTQASPHLIDMPLMMSGGRLTNNVDVDRALAQFQLFTMGRASHITDDIIGKDWKGGNKFRAAQRAAWLGSAMAYEAGMGVMLAYIAAMLTRDKKEKSEESTSKMFQKMALSALGSFVPILPNAIQSIMYGQDVIPAMSILYKGVKGGSSLLDGSGLGKASIPGGLGLVAGAYLGGPRWAAVGLAAGGAAGVVVGGMGKVKPAKAAKGIVDVLAALGAYKQVPGAFVAGRMARRAMPKDEPDTGFGSGRGFK